MSRSRMWWHKANHDRVLRDPYVRSLSFEALGLLTHLECLVGSTIRGHETGVLYSEDGARITVGELLFLLSRGDSAREASIRKSLEMLVRARQVKCNKPDLNEDGHLKLLHWQADQGLAKSGDVDRKRAEAERARAEKADSLQEHLRRLFARVGKSVCESDILNLIRARHGGRPQQRTVEAIFDIWFEQGVLLRDADGLCALAPLAGCTAPPLGAGAVGPVGDGAGGEIFPDGKIPVEEELDPDKGVLPNSQLDPVGRAGADTRPLGGGGAVQPASGAHSMGASSDTRHGNSKPSSVPDSRRGAVRLDVDAAPESLAECMYEPADAWRVDDPVHAAGRLLASLPGWNDVHQPERGKPKSEYVLLARWKDLRRDHGPKRASEIWRTVLENAISDKLEGHSWRTWTGLFLKRLEKLSAVESVEVGS